jgi:ElaB/YqjD/DUF883 family membrane-anchored ribosome-binding protein
MDPTPQHNSKDSVVDSQAHSSAARDKLMSELKAAIGEAENWLNDANGQPAPEASEASQTRARFDDTLRTARSDLRKLEDSVIARSRSAAESTNVYVHDNPWKSVVIGATLGVIVGMLVSRK